jgi:hypothetical protein
MKSFRLRKSCLTFHCLQTHRFFVTDTLSLSSMLWSAQNFPALNCASGKLSWLEKAALNLSDDALAAFVVHWKLLSHVI